MWSYRREVRELKNRLVKVKRNFLIIIVSYEVLTYMQVTSYTL